jgi:hypothetical protein
MGTLLSIYSSIMSLLLPRIVIKKKVGYNSGKRKGDAIINCRQQLQPTSLFLVNKQTPAPNTMLS